MAMNSDKKTTWLHRLLDAAKNGGVRLVGDDPTGVGLANVRAAFMKAKQTILAAPLFVMQHDGAELENEILFEHAMADWPGLPYPRMILEFSVASDDETGRFIFFASEEED